MDIHEFLAKLEGVHESGGGWVARCPAHGDDNPSLSIARGEDGRILVHCHAGCSAAEVVQSMGLKLADLMPEKERPRKAVKGKWGRWVCDYLYTDEAGKVLYKSCRYVRDADGKKTFIIKVPDPKSKYGWGFGLSKANIARVPYKLPRVVAAAKAGKSIVIVEGEKDADNLESVAKCAVTCNVAGALKWGYKFPADWGKWFEGARSVLIIADNDPQTKSVEKKVKGEKAVVEIEHWRGQKHAADVRRKLLAAGFKGDIRLMVMPQVEGQGHVKDFTDWMEARQAAGLPADRDAFLEAVKAADPWPAEWDFDEESIARAADDQESEKRSASRGGDKSGSSDIAPIGRFGRPVPRAPCEKPLEYMVDFTVGGGNSVRLTFNYGDSHADMVAYAMSAVARECPGNVLPKGAPMRIFVWCAAVWLLMRGSFFWHNDYRDFATCMYLDRDEGSCKLMRVMSDEFFAFVGAAARLEDVDPKRGDMAKILGLVKQIAVDPDYSRGVTPSNSWDRRGNCIYISTGDTKMCKITAHGVEVVQNGTDGVVFLRGKTLAPWKLGEEGVDPFSTTALFRGASFADDNGLMNVRLWVMNLFACHATKPPLLITGGAGSGKTRMAKGIKEILGMRQDGALDLSVQQIEDGDKGLDAFWATVNDGRLEVFDNFDTKVKWASDTLQTAATDGQTKRRTLYTTFGVSILRANAHIILTSNNPIFSTEGNGGLADRLITIPLNINRSTSKDVELSREIASNRDKYMTWIARTLAKVLADDVPVDASVNRRHPDYGAFAVKVGRAIGEEHKSIAALGAAEADKALLPLRNDIVTKEILIVLQANGWKWSGTAGDMSEKIIEFQEDEDEKTKQIYSCRRVGKALNKYLRQFSIIFRTGEPRISSGRSIYSFYGLTALGQAVVGLVGNEGHIAQTICDETEFKFPADGESNPPIPPGGDARARADASPSSVKEEEEEGIEDDDGGFLL